MLTHNLNIFQVSRNLENTSKHRLHSVIHVCAFANYAQKGEEEIFNNTMLFCKENRYSLEEDKSVKSDFDTRNWLQKMQTKLILEMKQKYFESIFVKCMKLFFLSEPICSTYKKAMRINRKKI